MTGDCRLGIPGNRLPGRTGRDRTLIRLCSSDIPPLIIMGFGGTIYMSAGLPMAVWAESACPVGLWQSRPVSASSPGIRLLPLGNWYSRCSPVADPRVPIVASCVAVPSGRFVPPTYLTALSMSLAGLSCNSVEAVECEAHDSSNLVERLAMS